MTNIFCTIKVIKNSGGIIVGAVVGKWYFYQSDPMNGFKSGIDSVIGCLGSICLGSLIIAPVYSIKYISSFFSCKPGFCSGQREEDNLFVQCNPYAYAFVRVKTFFLYFKLFCFFIYTFIKLCLYGTNLFDASTNALQTFQKNGISNLFPFICVVNS